MPMNVGVNKIPPLPSSLSNRFTSGLFAIVHLYQSSVALIRLLRNIMQFQSK